MLKLMADCFDKNMIDKDEYPRTDDLEQRCVRMLADLWHAEDPRNPTGCSRNKPVRFRRYRQD
jgi:glutamate decarboxylase